MINTEFAELSLSTSCFDQKMEDYLDSKREKWIRKASPLSLCECATHPMSRRIKIENQIVRELLTIHPPSKDLRLSLLSIGSGGLLQDCLLIKKLKKVGYDKFDLVTVDPIENKSGIIKLQSCLSGLNLRILSLSDLKSFNKEMNQISEENKISAQFHFIYAIDFELVCQNTEDAWKVLNLSKTHLAFNGAIFCSSSSSTYTFKAQTGWDLNPEVDSIGEKVANKFYLSSKINCLTLSSFRKATVEFIFSFIKKGITDISVTFLYNDADTAIWKAPYDKENEEVVQKIFPQAKIVFISTHQIEENYGFNVLIQPDKAVVNDINFSDNGLQLKEKLKLTPHLDITYL